MCVNATKKHMAHRAQQPVMMMVILLYIRQERAMATAADAAAHQNQYMHACSRSCVARLNEYFH